MKNRKFFKNIFVLLVLIASIGWFGCSELTKREISGSINPTNNTVVIFDFDGVICDSFHQFIQAFNGIASYYNLTKVGNEDLEDIHNYETEYIFKKHGVNFWKMPVVVYHLKSNMKQLIPTLKLYKGIKETIEELISKGITVGILTSNSQEIVSVFLKNNDLGGFQFIFSGSGMFGKAKNLKLIKDQLGAETIFYVGDEARDVKAANEANVQSIAVTWGFHSKKLLESSNPKAIIDKPRDLIDIVSK